MKLIDLSHEIEAEMITYPGLPGPAMNDFLSREQSRNKYAKGTEFHIGKIEMVGNTGTYVDSPFHRYENGIDLSNIPLNSLANLDGVVVRVPKNIRSIEPEIFRRFDLKNKAVLFHTGWDRHWRTDQYGQNNPFLTRDSVEMLVKSGSTLVGIDSVNIDDMADSSRPAHSVLLAANIPIVEHLCNLDQLPDSGFRFFAVPPRVAKFSSFPARVFAMVDAV